MVGGGWLGWCGCCGVVCGERYAWGLVCWLLVLCVVGRSWCVYLHGGAMVVREWFAAHGAGLAVIGCVCVCVSVVSVVIPVA